VIPADAADKPLVLKFSTWTSKKSTYVPSNTWILKEVEKRSKGRLKIEFYYSGSLVPARETLKGLQTGVADIALVPTSYAPGKSPLSTVGSNPMTGQRFYSTAMGFSEVAKLPEVKAELDRYNVRYLSFSNNSVYHIKRS
jgi:TRAP-type C4-dicarboxylate transport system substrate-binding protein